MESEDIVEQFVKDHGWQPKIYNRNKNDVTLLRVSEFLRTFGSWPVIYFKINTEIMFGREIYSTGSWAPSPSRVAFSITVYTPNTINSVGYAWCDLAEPGSLEQLIGDLDTLAHETHADLARIEEILRKRVAIYTWKP